jgi:hypothetical protein
LIAADRVNPQVNPNDGVPLLDNPIHNPIHWMINLTIKTSNPRQAIQDKQSKTSNQPLGSSANERSMYPQTFKHSSASTQFQVLASL